MAKTSVHSKVSVDTTPSSLRLGIIEEKPSRLGSSRVTEWTSPRPSMTRNPHRFRLEVTCSDPPEEPMAVKPPTVWWVTPPVS
jgi:hypothetical protein